MELFLSVRLKNIIEPTICITINPDLKAGVGVFQPLQVFSRHF